MSPFAKYLNIRSNSYLVPSSRPHPFIKSTKRILSTFGHAHSQGSSLEVWGRPGNEDNAIDTCLLACVAGRRAREGKGGIGLGGEGEGTYPHAHPSRVTLTRFAQSFSPFPPLRRRPRRLLAYSLSILIKVGGAQPFFLPSFNQ